MSLSSALALDRSLCSLGGGSTNTRRTAPWTVPLYRQTVQYTDTAWQRDMEAEALEYHRANVLEAVEAELEDAADNYPVPIEQGTLLVGDMVDVVKCPLCHEFTDNLHYHQEFDCTEVE